MFQITLTNGRILPFDYPPSPFMEFIVKNIFQGKEYPIVNLPGYQPQTILDIGANVGATAIFFHNAFPSAKIFCYEPASENLIYLRKNTQLIEQIDVFPYGLFDQSCKLPLFLGSSQCAQNSLFLNSGTSKEFELVELRNIIDELNDRQITEISILKIDTEGSEIPILRGIVSMKIEMDLIYFEYHSEQDRRDIDQLLGEQYLLHSMNANLHRGSGIYISSKLLKCYPQLEQMKIKR